MGSYQLSGENDNPRNLLFPPPSEVNGGSYTNELPKTGEVSKFPYPREVNGGSYEVINYNIQVIQFAFPSPFEVTGVNY